MDEWRSERPVVLATLTLSPFQLVWFVSGNEIFCNHWLFSMRNVMLENQNLPLF